MRCSGRVNASQSCCVRWDGYVSNLRVPRTRHGPLVTMFRGRPGGAVPLGEVLGDNIVDGGGVGEYPLVPLKGVKCVLEDERDYALEFPLLPKVLPLSSCGADLSTEVRT